MPKSEVAGTSSGPLSWQLGPTPEDGFQVRAGGLLIGLSSLAYGVEAVSHSGGDTLRGGVVLGAGATGYILFGGQKTIGGGDCR